MTDKEKLHQILSSLWKNDDSIGKTYYNQALQDVQIAIDSMQEDPVSEDLDEAGKEWLRPQLDKSYANYGETKMMELTHFDGYSMLEAIEFGAKWKEEQFEKNRLEHCNSITNEQAELEQGFIDQHLDKHDRMPTFLDAIEYGMRLQKEQMMKQAVDAGCFGFQGAALFSFRLPSDRYLVGSKVKVIVIKED